MDVFYFETDGGWMGPVGKEKLESFIDKGIVRRETIIKSSGREPLPAQELFPDKWGTSTAKNATTETNEATTRRKKRNENSSTKPDQFFLLVGKSWKGPLTKDKVLRLCRDGTITAESYVSLNKAKGVKASELFGAKWVEMTASPADERDGPQIQQQPPIPLPPKKERQQIQEPPKAQSQQQPQKLQIAQSQNPYSEPPIANTPRAPKYTLGEIHQLDDNIYLCENNNKLAVFRAIARGLNNHPGLSVFEKSLMLKGECADSGLLFTIRVSDHEEGSQIVLDLNSQSGALNFDLWFNPTSAKGWGVFGATQAFNYFSTESKKMRLRDDYAMLLGKIMTEFGAYHLIPEKDVESERLAEEGKEDLKKIGKGCLIFIAVAWVLGLILGVLKFLFTGSFG